MLRNLIFYTFLLILTRLYAKETDDGKQVYMEVFSNIPRMVESLRRLSEKPEMLEKNDVTVFVRSANYSKQPKSKRNAYCELESDADAQSECKRDSSQSKREIKINGNRELEQLSDKKNNQVKGGSNINRDAAEPSNNFNTNIDVPKKHNYNSPNEKNGDARGQHLENVKKIVNRASKITKKETMVRVDRLAKKRANILNRRSIGVSKLLRLSPEEIEDAVLEVEQMLEDYNNKQLKDNE